MIYLDTCVVIYAIDDPTEWGDRARSLLAEVDSADLAVSPVVEMEALVGPLRAMDFAAIDDYRELLARYRMIEPDRRMYQRAAELRAAHGLKAIDALHLAVADLGGCDALWTNDDRLARASKTAVNVFRAW